MADRRFTGKFMAVLRALQQEGVLTHEVEIDHRLMFDELRYTCQLSFCKDNFGADALTRHTGDWTFKAELTWTYYKTSFFFSNEDDAVLFKLSLS